MRLTQITKLNIIDAEKEICWQLLLVSHWWGSYSGGAQVGGGGARHTRCHLCPKNSRSGLSPNFLAFEPGGDMESFRIILNRIFICLIILQLQFEEAFVVIWVSQFLVFENLEREGKFCYDLCSWPVVSYKGRLFPQLEVVHLLLLLLPGIWKFGRNSNVVLVVNTTYLNGRLVSQKMTPLIKKLYSYDPMTIGNSTVNVPTAFAFTSIIGFSFAQLTFIWSCHGNFALIPEINFEVWTSSFFLTSKYLLIESCIAISISLEQSIASGSLQIISAVFRMQPIILFSFSKISRASSFLAFSSPSGEDSFCMGSLFNSASETPEAGFLNFLSIHLKQLLIVV